MSEQEKVQTKSVPVDTIEKIPGSGGGEIRKNLEVRKAEAQNADLAKRMEEIRKQRELDIAEGKKLGEEYFGQESLGRSTLTPEQQSLMSDILAKRQAAQAGAGTQSAEMSGLLSKARSQADTAGQRSADIADIIARRKAGLEGYSSEENSAMRAAMEQRIAQSEAGGLRQLKGIQAQSGVRGGLAAAQQLGVAQQAQQARAAGARDLFLQNIAQKQSALGNLEQSVTGAETSEFGRGQQALQFATGAQSSEEGRMFGQGQQALGSLEATQQSQLANAQAMEQFNLGQAAKEKYGQLAAQLGFAQMGTGERSALLQQILGEQQIGSEEKIAEQNKK